jgi:HSP20 family protein
MKLTQWEPFRDMEQFLARISPPSLWPPTRALPELASAKLQWAPSADISETEQEYLIRAELPAVRKEDVQVTLEDGTITIRGERKQQQTEKTEKFHRVESFTGEFSRRFSLPDDADADGVKAESKDGVLTVHIPKRAVSKPAPLQIKVE